MAPSKVAALPGDADLSRFVSCPEEAPMADSSAFGKALSRVLASGLMAALTLLPSERGQAATPASGSSATTTKTERSPWASAMTQLDAARSSIGVAAP